MHIETLRWKSHGGWNRSAKAVQSPVDLILYFGPTALLEQPDSPWRELHAAHPGAVCAGCSTAGEIFQNTVSDGSLCATLVRFSSTHVRGAVRTVASPAGSTAAGTALARELSKPDLRHVLVLSEGLGINGTALTASLRKALPEGVHVTGGLAGDGAAFQRTVVGLGGTLRPGQVVAIGFYGENLRTLWGSAGGWIPFGPKLRITRAKGNVLYELDGHPALALYKKHLGKRAAGLPATGLFFPLQLLTDEHPENGIVRTIIGVDEATQSLTFAGDMPVGQHARLMKASSSVLIAGAEAAAGQIFAPTDGEHLALMVSCVGRKLVLGKRTVDEVKAALRCLPPDTRALGFYSYGEICPSEFVSSCDLHNQTMTITLFNEAP